MSGLGDIRTTDHCPAWCEEKHGSDDERVTGRPARTHARDINDSASLVVDEYADEPGVGRPPHLRLWVGGNEAAHGREWTSAEARQIAADLLNAADELDKVSGAQQWTEDLL